METPPESWHPKPRVVTAPEKCCDRLVHVLGLQPSERGSTSVALLPRAARDERSPPARAARTTARPPCNASQREGERSASRLYQQRPCLVERCTHWPSCMPSATTTVRPDDPGERTQGQGSAREVDVAPSDPPTRVTTRRPGLVALGSPPQTSDAAQRTARRAPKRPVRPRPSTGRGRGL